MKKLFLVVLVVCFAVRAQDAKPNFSGTWELQVDKSDFGPLPAPQAQTTIVDHKEPNLKVTITAKTQQGERTSVRNLTTDGQENTNTVGATTIRSKTRWVEKELVTEATFEAQAGKIQTKDRWQLSDEGKTFTIDRTLSSEMGEATQKWVYSKK